MRPGRRLHPGDQVVFGDGRLRATIEGYGEEGTRKVRFFCDGDFLQTLEEIGSMPLPPYIEREADEEDRERYQNVYAREEGSVACATAGLHWTEELIEKARQKGVQTVYVTLHVGIGTFRPVQEEQVEAHHMHTEAYSVSREAAACINAAKEAGGRVIAVGTTACRTLESCAEEDGTLRAQSGDTGIFIYPGYRFKIVDALITNFHLPKSTLLMLVSAFYTREDVLRIYEEAVRERYAFFSYGDAMFLY